MSGVKEVKRKRQFPDRSQGQDTGKGTGGRKEAEGERRQKTY